MPETAPEVGRIRQRHLVGMPHWVARALCELLRARIVLVRIKARDIARLNSAAQRSAAQHSAGQAVVVTRRNSAAHPDAVARVAFIVPLLARYVPWRSDCLVQALAGQHWLARSGIPSEIVVGTAKSADGVFEAHAWLRQGERIVLGGDIARFRPLLEPDTTILDRL